MNRPRPIEALYAEPEATRYDAFARAVERFRPATVEEVGDLDALRRRLAATLSATEAKRRLILAVNRGAFVKPFPGGCASCARAEHFLLHAVGCPLDCDYCFLIAYTTCHVPTVFVNVDDMAREVDRAAETNAALTLHAGELADALVFEPVSRAAQALDEVLLRRANVTVEYRTKWTETEPFERLRARSNSVVAWTLSPAGAARAHEHGAPGPRARIAAMAALAAKGFTVGVRLDPIIHRPGWRRGYEELLTDLVDTVPAHAIDKVVLGALRFPAGAEQRLRRRLGASPLLAGEFVLDGQGKLRYHRFLRLRLYRELIEILSRLAPALPVELAMESNEVREAVGV